MEHELILTIIVLVSGMYMAWNIGANDVANAMGTSVGSGVLNLRQAVIIAAVLEFSGAFFFGSHVSETVQQGIVNPLVFQAIPMQFVLGMLSSLIASGIWLQVASYYGWPVSTTHTIVGAIIGFGVVIGGVDAIYWENVAWIFSSWVLSPLMGGVLGFLIFSLLRKKIFYAMCPVEATKKLAPYIAFCFTTIISILLLFNGLKNVQIDFSFDKAVFYSLLIGLFFALATYFVVKRIKTPERELKPQIDFSPDALLALDKARRQLAVVQNKTQGTVAYQAALALEEVERLSKAMKSRASIGSTDYGTVERIFGFLQILSACLMAFAHGANDVANAIGPLTAALRVLTTGSVSSNYDAGASTWLLALGGFGIVVGLATWGWRVIETIGKKITELTPSRGFTAEFSAAVTIVLATRLGLPVSTTHTLVGAVIGVGMARGLEALDLNTTRDIVISWFITVPAGALLSVAIFSLLNLIF